MLKVALGSGGDGYSDTVELVDGEQQISMTIEHAYYTMGTSLAYPCDIDVFHVTIWGAQYDARAVLFTSLRASEGNIRVGFDDGLVPIYFETTVPNVHVPETVPSVPPTCVDYGLTKSRRCTVCGLELSDQAEIVPTGHTLVDGSCIHCDYKQSEDDYVPADPYVFHYDVAGDAYEGYNHQHFSPYITRYAYNDGECGGISTIFQHSMYNAVTGDVIPTYCMDIFTGVYSDTTYRRLNIDDSTNYTAGWNADLLRAIMLGGFYLAPVQGETMEEHEARVQDKLQILRDATGISDLTVGEAIAATQLAIWKAAHGEKLVFESMVHSIYAYASNQPSLFQYYDLCNEERQNGHYEIKGGFLTAESKAYLTQRIETLYHYLLALPPVETNSEIIANNHGVSSYNNHCIRNTDGTYDVHLKVYVFDYEWNPEGSFTLTAYIDAAHYVQSEVLPGVHSYNMVLKNVPEESLYNRETGEIGKVTVALDGTQTVSDVVLYEARGGAEFSQSMLGMDNSRVPVHSEITENITRVKEYVNLDMSHSVSLGSNIAINYIIPREKIGNLSECYFYCFVGDEVVRLEPKLRGDYAYFTYDGLTAVNMNDEILAWLYYTQGEMESEYDLGRYSVATYAYSMLNKEGIPEQAKDVCANLLRYGSAVQRFKDYKVDDLPDGKLTEEQRGYLTDLDTVEFAEPYKILKDVADPTVKWAGRSMSLESTIALKQVIDISNYPGDPTALELRMSYTDVRGEEKLVTLNPTLYNEEHQLYAFTVTQLNAADLRSTLTCQVFAEGKPVSQTMVYSPDSYGNRKTGVMLELCQALFAYVDCARAFFAG